MSVIPNDLLVYGSAQMPEADNVTTGGAVDFSRRVAFYDISPAGTLDFVSSNASDTHVQIQVAGRDASGVIQTPAAVTLNGTTLVTGGQSFERLLYGIVSGANPAAAGTYFPLAAPTGGATGVTNAAMTNTSTTLSFAAAPTNFPSVGNYYVGVDTGANFEIMQVTGGQGGASLTVTRGVSGFQGGVAHSSGVAVYLMPLGDVAAISATAVISARTAQAGSSNHSGVTPPLFKLASGDGALVTPGMIIRITSGTGAAQLRQVIGWASNGTGIPSGAPVYGADTVAVNRDWSTTPDATSIYSIYQGMLFETGFAASGAVYGDPNPVTSVLRCFSTAAADVPGGSQRFFYEKVFTVNNNAATALTAAQAEIVSATPSLPSGALLDLGPSAGLNDTATIANRQTAPGSVAFTTQPALINVPGAGNLPSGGAPNSAGAQAWWLRLTLPAGTAAYKGSFDLRIQGVTT